MISAASPMQKGNSRGWSTPHSEAPPPSWTPCLLQKRGTGLQSWIRGLLWSICPLHLLLPVLSDIPQLKTLRHFQSFLQAFHTKSSRRLVCETDKFWCRKPPHGILFPFDIPPKRLYILILPAPKFNGIKLPFASTSMAAFDVSLA